MEKLISVAMGRRTWGFDLIGPTWKLWYTERVTNTDRSLPAGKVSVLQAEQWQMGTKQAARLRWVPLSRPVVLGYTFPMATLNT
jgi:hypothetical protein